MKETDMSTVQAAAIDELENEGGSILDFLSLDDAAVCLTMIYMTNDLATGFGQDYQNNISIVSSPTRIAILGFGRHSFYKVDNRICLYESLTDDLHEINVVLDAAIARWETQTV